MLWRLQIGLLRPSTQCVQLIMGGKPIACQRLISVWWLWKAGLVKGWSCGCTSPLAGAQKCSRL